MSNSRTASSALFALCALSMSTPGAAATLSYRAVDLGALPGDDNSWARGLNDRGEIVGESWGVTDPATQQAPTHAVMWRGGTVLDLGALPAPYNYKTEATGINFSRTIVGTGAAADGTSRAFIWENGVMTELGTLGGPSSGGVAINDFNQVVGWAETAVSFERKGRVLYVAHAFLWEHGKMIDLGTLGCSSCLADGDSYPTDINDWGEVVGHGSSSSGYYAAFLWKHGTMRQLIGLTSGDQVEAAGINLRGDVAGDDDTQNYTSVIWRHGGSASSLLDVCPDMGVAVGLNDFGAVLAYGRSPTTSFETAEVCYKKTLNFLPSIGPAWGDFIPSRMNNHGVVVGIGYVSTSATTALERAVLWIPKLSMTLD